MQSISQSGFFIPLHLLRFCFLIIGLVVSFSSCVPNKKIVYLQKDDLKGENPTDTVMRVYDLKKEDYKLKPSDIISLRVASTTEGEYNFIKKYETDLGVIRKLNQYSQGEDNEGSGMQRSNRMIGGGGDDSGIPTISLDQLNTGFVLDENGELNLPQIGLIKLAGLTISEAEIKIRKALEGYYETPMVRIQLLNFHFTILGEVNSEGRYISYDPQTTIFDAISLSGNLTEFADRANIKIVRQQGEIAEIIYLNTLDESTLSADNYYLQRGDLIIVPPLEARTTNQYTLPNVSRTFGIVSTALSLLALIISLNSR